MDVGSASFVFTNLGFFFVRAIEWSGVGEADGAVRASVTELEAVGGGVWGVMDVLRRCSNLLPLLCPFRWHSTGMPVGAWRSRGKATAPVREEDDADACP